MRLILCDIDGTLLWTDGAGRRAIKHALETVAGTSGPIDSYRLDGKTDPQIVADLLSLTGHPRADDAALADAVCRRYIDLLAQELERSPHTARPLPGVAELLAGLEPHEAAGRALVGILTGNLASGAALKLRAAGVDPARFAVGAYGSDSGRRADLPAIALERAAARTGRRLAGGDAVIVGDTPADVACGRPIGALSLAVAIGYYDVAALRLIAASLAILTRAATCRRVDSLLGLSSVLLPRLSSRRM